MGKMTMESSVQNDSPPSQPHSKTKIIDPRGDVWVLVYGSGSWGPQPPMKFQVCSRALARASPVFDKMLYGDFAESKRAVLNGEQKHWEISLEDPPSAMEQVFLIMHCRFVTLQKPDEDTDNSIVADTEMVQDGDEEHEDSDHNRKHDSPEGANSTAGPNEGKTQPPYTTIRQLHDLIAVADFYDCISILKPWVSDWLQELGPSAVEEEDIMRRASIYYFLGHAKVYERAVCQLAIDFPNRGAAGYTAESEFLPIENLPPYLLDAVISLQQQANQAMLDTIHQTMILLLEAQDTPTHLCKAVIHTSHGRRPPAQAERDEKIKCELQLLGLFHRVLHQAGLWPLPTAESIRVSPRSFYKSMGRLRERYFASDAYGAHSRCVLELEPEGGFESYRYVISDEEAAQMARQRQLTGIALDTTTNQTC